MNAGRAVIVGSATGIGAAGARQLATDGWRLALLDRDAAALEQTAAACGAVHAGVVDVADPAAIARAMDEAVGALDGLDAAWSNAGVQHGGSARTLTTSALDESYAVNVRAHLIVAQSAASAMRRGGSVLVTASNSGLQTEPDALAYATTKAAAIALVRGLARDLAAEGIRVNALCPGYVDTPFNQPLWRSFGGRDGFLSNVGEVIPLGRMASAEEIARIACFMLGDDAGYMTGHALVADGGELVG